MSVAQRENSVIVLEEDYQTKYQSFDPNSPESYISHQLQWMAHYESSLLFASEVVEHMIYKPLTPRRIVIDQDIFQVLVEANMPAVLLELAFVTNPTEYKYLASSDGQKELADRLFKAFKSYKTKFDASVSVAKADIPKAESESYYSVQVMGLSRLINKGDASFKGLDIHHVKGENSNIYKYVCGKHDNLESAKRNLSEVRKKFPEAFLVKVINNDVKRVD
jgi:N-acetylmuramoyl-L-alanine amidase